MKRILILFVLITGISTVTKSNAQSDSIPWSKDRKLKWSDFKAAPNPEVVAHAQTAYRIEIMPNKVSVDANNNIQNYELLTVVTNFYPAHS